MHSRIPSYTELVEGTVHLPGHEIQFGCVWCVRDDKIDGPAKGGVIYMYAGTTTCAPHLKSILEQQVTNVPTQPSS
jgi:hypothetical protein